MSKEIGKRLSEQATKIVRLEDNYDADNKIRIETLMKEPKVRVYGNTLYKDFLGDYYTFDYQDNPVTIMFNGTWQEYPQTIAELLLQKLDAAANANTYREVGMGEKI